MEITLIFKRDVQGIYGMKYQKGEEKKYHPWCCEWQGMSEPERVDKGIFVECFGQGEFNVFNRADVTPIINCKAS